MAKQDILMPQMGESITTGTITKWHKRPGDLVELDEMLFEISTDKVESEIPSPVKGRVWALFGEEGDTLEVGKKVAEIEMDLSIPFTAGAASPKAASVTPSTAAPVAANTVSALVTAQSPAATGTADTADEGTRFYTPLVKALAKEHSIPLSELANLKGTGAGGRVNRDDFLAYVANRAKGQPASAASVGASSRAAAAASAAASVGVSLPNVTLPPAYRQGDRVEILPMDNMRKTIMKNMVASKLTSPHVNSMALVDLTHLVKFRESFKDEFKKQEGFALTYTAFILRAITLALKDHPNVNASVDGDNLVLKKDINLGCAVAVPGNGLIVPIIHGADNLNMLGLCRKLNDLANRARSRKLTMDDLVGGTYTMTNVGSFGTLFATPVILQPQVGIYAAGVIHKQVMVMADDSIGIRSVMYGTHAYDHRVVDGELGGNFLNSVHRHLTDMDLKTLF